MPGHGTTLCSARGISATGCGSAVWTRRSVSVRALWTDGGCQEPGRTDMAPQAPRARAPTSPGRVAARGRGRRAVPGVRGCRLTSACGGTASCLLSVCVSLVTNERVGHVRACLPPTRVTAERPLQHLAHVDSHPFAVDLWLLPDRPGRCPVRVSRALAAVRGRPASCSHGQVLRVAGRPVAVRSL